jgi:hypothetical protein
MIYHRAAKVKAVLFYAVGLVTLAVLMKENKKVNISLSQRTKKRKQLQKKN